MNHQRNTDLRKSIIMKLQSLAKIIEIKSISPNKTNRQQEQISKNKAKFVNTTTDLEK